MEGRNEDRRAERLEERLGSCLYTRKEKLLLPLCGRPEHLQGFHRTSTGCNFSLAGQCSGTNSVNIVSCKFPRPPRSLVPCHLPFSLSLSLTLFRARWRLPSNITAPSPRYAAVCERLREATRGYERLLNRFSDLSDPPGTDVSRRCLAPRVERRQKIAVKSEQISLRGPMSSYESNLKSAINLVLDECACYSTALS